jgi:hypothetical protein
MRLDTFLYHYTRQTLWNWKTGKAPVPEQVEVILAEVRRVRRYTPIIG